MCEKRGLIDLASIRSRRVEIIEWPPISTVTLNSGGTAKAYSPFTLVGIKTA